MLPAFGHEAGDLSHKRRHERVVAGALFGDGSERRLPPGCHVRKREGLRQRLDQSPAGGRGLYVFAYARQETAPKQQFDNACSCRFRAEAIGVFEHLAQLAVPHERGDARHGGQQSSVVEPRGR